MVIIVSLNWQLTFRNIKRLKCCVNQGLLLGTADDGGITRLDKKVLEHCILILALVHLFSLTLSLQTHWNDIVGRDVNLRPWLLSSFRFANYMGFIIFHFIQSNQLSLDAPCIFILIRLSCEKVVFLNVF